MESPNNSSKEKAIISDLLNNLNTFNESINALEGNLKSNMMQSANLSASSKKSINNVNFELG